MERFIPKNNLEHDVDKSFDVTLSVLNVTSRVLYFSACHTIQLDKTQCINFSHSSTVGACNFHFCGKSIFCAKSVVHLGHVLT